MINIRGERLKIRVQKFIDALGIKKSEFCKNVRIGYSTYYAWMKGRINLSENTMDRIDNYLNHFLF